MAHRGRRNAYDALALAVACGQPLRAVAQTAGVSERTATRRWADSEFRRRVGVLRRPRARTFRVIRELLGRGLVVCLLDRMLLIYPGADLDAQIPA